MLFNYGYERPDVVTICGSKWVVLWHQEMEEMGLCEFNRQRILISKDVSPTLSVDVLLHEILHAVWWFGSLPDTASEEQSISVLSSGLNSIFASNPGIAAWILEIHSK